MGIGAEILKELEAEDKAVVAQALGLVQPNADEPPTGLGYSDLDNAVRLAERHGQDLRYCWPWRKWLAWDGRRWRVDDTGEVARQAKETVRQMIREAAAIEDDEAREKALDAARKCQARHKIEAMVALAASEPGIPVLPEEMDRDPWLLNVVNGTIDLRTGELRPHRREDMLTKLAPVEYDPEAKCHRWEAFLDRIMAGNKELIRYLQKAAGYSLTADVSEQVFFLLHGSGANGKSVFLNTLLAVLGDYGTQAAPDLLMAKKSERHPTELADLRGARLVVALETEEGRRLAESLVKWLTGGDRIKARRMREDFFEFASTFKIWLASNHKPIVRGSDYAMWRRIRLIPFTVTIPPEEQDKQLPAKLREELPGILRWAVEGCLAWQREGLGEPPEVVEATAEYRAEMDAIANFLAECCIVNPLAKVPVATLYRAYTEWAQENGEWVLSQRELGTRLKERGFSQRKANKGRVFWIGLGLRDDHGEVEKVDKGGVNSGMNAYIRESQKSTKTLVHPTPLSPPDSRNTPGPCPACGGHSWWLSKMGRWVCQVCHPCPDPSLAVEVVEA